MDIEKFSPVLKTICAAANGAFVGSNFYILSVEFPALDEHSYGCVLKILRLQHRHLVRMQVGLCLMTGLSGVGVYFMDKEKNFPFLVAGSVMLACMPFSKFAISPSYSTLIKPDAKDTMEESEAREKLSTVRKMMSVRAVASLTAFGYLLYHLTS